MEILTDITLGVCVLTIAILGYCVISLKLKLFEKCIYIAISNNKINTPEIEEFCRKHLKVKVPIIVIISIRNELYYKYPHIKDILNLHKENIND